MANILYFSFIDTPLGISIASWQNEKLVSFVLPRREQNSALRHFTKQCQRLDVFPREERKDPFGLQELLENYFHGTAISLSIDLFSFAMYPPFTQNVLRATAQIPYATIRTYRDIAQAIGAPFAFRAVGQSLGKNLLPLFIPCHRVVSQNSLGGFGEGLRFKVLLLSLEYSHFTSYPFCHGTFQEDADAFINQESNGSINSPLEEIKRNNRRKKHSPHYAPGYPEVNGGHH